MIVTIIVGCQVVNALYFKVIIVGFFSLSIKLVYSYVSDVLSQLY